VNGKDSKTGTMDTAYIRFGKI